MLRIMMIVCAMIGLSVSEAGALSQSFDVTVAAFRQALDARIKQDTRGGIASCRARSKLEVDCTFRGNPNAGARGVLGRIDHREHIALQTADGKLVEIILNGQRNTQAAQKHFIGLVTSAVEALDPVLDHAKIGTIVDGLGLTRDDSAPDIGDARSYSAPGWTIQCLSQVSQVSTDLACTVQPGST